MTQLLSCVEGGKSILLLGLLRARDSERSMSDALTLPFSGAPLVARPLQRWVGRRLRSERRQRYPASWLHHLERFWLSMAPSHRQTRNSFTSSEAAASQGRFRQLYFR